LIDELGLGDRVRLLGYQAEVRDLFEAMDVFALSSLREALPNVVLEAMALDVPVVATRVAGVPGVIDEGTSGLLVTPGSVDELAQGLCRLLTDPDTRQRFRTAARQTVVRRFSFEVRMRKVQEIYDSLLPQRSGLP
jgi:glycosyltransferase involved in cell wall biosynthesis